MIREHLLVVVPGVCVFAGLAQAGPAKLGDSSADRETPTSVPAPGHTQPDHAPEQKGKRVRLQTAPAATCLLHGANGDSDGVSLYADDDGEIEFFVTPHAPTDLDVRYALDCVADQGSLDTQFGDLRSAVAKTSPRSADGKSSAGPERRVISLRPALLGDPMLYSQAELLVAGYPLRPDPIVSPADYAKWKDLVSVPAQMVSSRLVRRPSYAATSRNWCGYVADQPNATFSLAKGYFQIPSVAQICSGCNTGAGLWAGLDGSWSADGRRSHDVVQAGAEMDAFSFFGTQINSYYVWREWYPDVQESISNMHADPGDTFYVQVWMGDSSGNLNPNGGYAWFYLQNLTNNYYYYGSKIRPFWFPSDAAFLGNTAEWIVEATGLTNGSTMLLSPFGSASMWGTSAWASSPVPGAPPGVYTLDNSHSYSMTMMNGSNLLCFPSRNNGTDFSYWWINYQ